MDFGVVACSILTYSGGVRVLRASRCKCRAQTDLTVLRAVIRRRRILFLGSWVIGFLGSSSVPGCAEVRWQILNLGRPSTDSNVCQLQDLFL